MEDPKKANETLQKLEDRDVRIIYLPPMTVAAARISGEAEYGVGPEADVYKRQSLSIVNKLSGAVHGFKEIERICNKNSYRNRYLY